MCVLHRLLPCIVDSKLRMDKDVIPVSHGWRDKMPQHIPDSAIHALSLTIRLRVKCSRHIPGHFEAVSQSLVVFASRLRASVRNNFQWRAMIAENAFNEQVSPSLCSALCCCRNNVHILCQTVNKDENSIIACLGLRKTSDKVSRYTIPWPLRYLQRLQ